MSGDLHLSDLSSELTQTVAELSYREKSLSGAISLCSPKLKQINDRSIRLKEYASHLQSIKSKLDEEQFQFEMNLKSSQSKVKEDEDDLKAQVTEIHIQTTKLKSRRENTEKSVIDGKRSILDLETEAARIAKKDEWAETILNSRYDFESREKTRNEILAVLDDLSELNSELRLVRTRIFEQQKILHDLSDTLAPLRVRKFALLERLEDAKQNPDLDEASSSLSITMMETKSFAISQQKFAIQKMRIEQNMMKLREEIDSARREKSELMQRLAPLRVRDESLIEKIALQAQQYKAGVERHRNMLERATASKEDFISKELDAKLEHDSIERELSAVRSEIMSVEELMNSQKRQIEEKTVWLRENIVTDDEVSTDITYESILAETISMIKQKREEGLSISAAEPLRDMEIDEEELNEFRNRLESRSRKVASVIKTTKIGCAALIKTIKSTKRSLSERAKDCEELGNRIIEARSRKPPMVIPETPKIRRESEKIEELEASISKLTEKVERKRSKIETHKSELEGMSEQIKNEGGLDFLASDILRRLDRAMKWLLPQITKYKTVNLKENRDWENRVLGAALNEAEELVMRASPLHLIVSDEK